MDFLSDVCGWFTLPGYTCTIIAWCDSARDHDSWYGPAIFDVKTRSDNKTPAGIQILPNMYEGRGYSTNVYNGQCSDAVNTYIHSMPTGHPMPPRSIINEFVDTNKTYNLDVPVVKYFCQDGICATTGFIQFDVNIDAYSSGAVILCITPTGMSEYYVSPRTRICVGIKHDGNMHYVSLKPLTRPDGKVVERYTDIEKLPKETRDEILKKNVMTLVIIPTIENPITADDLQDEIKRVRIERANPEPTRGGTCGLDVSGSDSDGEDNETTRGCARGTRGLDDSGGSDDETATRSCEREQKTVVIPNPLKMAQIEIGDKILDIPTTSISPIAPQTYIRDLTKLVTVVALNMYAMDPNQPSEIVSAALCSELVALPNKPADEILSRVYESVMRSAYVPQ